ncbi:MAG TPA: GNAT family N-acetyltransferase [Solirubrobacteraceae bacterium]|nr:GNAT family N-acetyltransferase [Solirubrobacteraceae bacterium]
MPTVTLRPAAAADLGYLAALAGDPRVEPFLAPGPADEERLGALLRSPGADAEDPTGLLVIEDAGASVGALALQLVSARSRIAELTRLMVDPDARRAGVATAAVRMACRRAFTEHSLHRVQAETYGDNLAGRRVFERAGFTCEGTRRRAYRRRQQWLDGVLYGLLAEELRD